MNHNDVSLILLLVFAIVGYWLRQGICDHLKGFHPEVHQQICAHPLNFAKFAFSRRHKDLNDVALSQKVTRLHLALGVVIGVQILISILK